MSLRDRLLKNSTIKDTDILENSKFFNKKDMIQTSIPAINIAYSGSLDGGLTPGLTQWCGPSRHFKTLFSLLSAKAYMDKYDDAVLLFYDSEFGTPKSYFGAVGIDMSRTLHTPLVNIEEMKFDVMTQLDSVVRGDHLIVIIDSIGNMASKKEMDDALDGKSVADMTRAKQLKSFFRMVTPHLNLKDIPMICVNHVYMTMEMFSKPIVSGGTGSMYSSDNVFIIGRQQDKDGKDLLGYNFIINVEKSRYVKEKSKIPVTVKFEGGVSKWSGLLDIALESGHVVKPKNGRYSVVNMATGEFDEKGVKVDATDTSQFWNPILQDQSFKDFVEKKYSVSHGNLVQEDEVASVFDDLDEED